jgi:esterase/lipase superfamily enzyme
VEDVHFLAHSAGAQVVTTFFSDPDSGVARLFDRPFPTATQSSQLLRLRTITLLNPDTKLSDFVVSDFKSMRRFCDHITVVGDRKDVALKWSERANGLLFSFKFIQTWFRLGCIPRSRSSLQRCCAEGCCQRNRHGQDRAFSHMPAVGRSIFSLYVFEEVDDDYDEEEGDHPPHAHSRHHRKWLDVDAIDTSSMETNVHQMRHAYFDLNKILVEDLHELIVTGKRASERSLLLHREGNIFSFCQAPACVVNQ